MGVASSWLRAALCVLVATVATGASEALAQDVDGLVAKLRDPDEKARQKAVQGLAEAATEEAYAAIVERALGDPSPRVADEAQLQLGRAQASAALFDAMDSKEGLRSRQALVRERSVEALGRVQGAVPIGLFARGLKDKEPGVRMVAAFALERRASGAPAALDVSSARPKASVLKLIAKMATSDRDEAARAAAILALGALDRRLGGELGDALKKAIRLDDRSAAVRAASLAVLGEGNSLDDLSAALGDEAQSVAMTALGILEARGDREAFLRLARALPEDASTAGRRALTSAIVASLRKASGLSTGAVRERWVRWAEGLAPDEKVAPKKRAGSDSKDAAEEASTTFYGLRLASDRLVFLVDMSGSMWDEKRGESRKKQAEAELARTLRQLPADTHFNLVPYANAPGPWETELVPATPKNVERAIQWFERNKLRGRGDVWSALLPVLRDPTVDTIVILFDGAPSGGTRWNVELMRSLLRDENRLRGVVLHTVLFDASRFLERTWKEISEDSGGTQQIIE